MEGIKLNKRQFEDFNDCDGYCLFKEQLKVIPEGKTGEQVIQECTNLLFEEFEFILVSEENKIYGVKGDNKTLLGGEEEAYSCAIDASKRNN